MPGPPEHEEVPSDTLFSTRPDDSRQTKRALLLTDEELLVVVAWAEVARSASQAAALPADITAHDFEDEDVGVLAKVWAARLG